LGHLVQQMQQHHQQQMQQHHQQHHQQQQQPCLRIYPSWAVKKKPLLLVPSLRQ
jgi:hypothetical protein